MKELETVQDPGQNNKGMKGASMPKWGACGLGEGRMLEKEGDHAGEGREHDGGGGMPKKEKERQGKREKIPEEVWKTPEKGGLLDRSTARYFYKGSKTSIHKHKGNLVENLFSKKCAFKNYLQLLK